MLATVSLVPSLIEYGLTASANQPLSLLVRDLSRPDAFLQPLGLLPLSTFALRSLWLGAVAAMIFVVASPMQLRSTSSTPTSDNSSKVGASDSAAASNNVSIGSGSSSVLAYLFGMCYGGHNTEQCGCMRPEARRCCPSTPEGKMKVGSWTLIVTSLVLMLGNFYQDSAMRRTRIRGIE